MKKDKKEIKEFRKLLKKDSKAFSKWLKIHGEVFDYKIKNKLDY